jgi:GNAT superfamily N-acetyltransferase
MFLTLAVFKIASLEEVRALSRRLLLEMQDKQSHVYQDNVAKFGIPDEYVQKVFSEESLLKAAQDRGALFYLALEDQELVGFAEIIPQDERTSELDRVILFPGHTGTGIGTDLLHRLMVDEKAKGKQAIIANAGRDETLARRFYEKNGFKVADEPTIEAPWGGKLHLVTYRCELS